MLKEIRCNVFREPEIKFHAGLNVVLGDNQGSNSIGKSSLLMIIDFVFGGNSYIDHNSDTVKELGHHHFQFIFSFNDEFFYFQRGTELHKEVYVCDNNFQIVKTIPIKEYLFFLKGKYVLPSNHLNFRSAVSLFSRIWGKYNLDVRRPLHTFPKEKNADTVERILLVFNEYDHVIEDVKVLKVLRESRTTLNKASKFEFIPKITKSKYERNLKEKSQIEAEVTTIQNNLFQETLNLREKVTEEVFKLQNEKNRMLEERDYFKAQLNRISKNLKVKHSNQKFEKLIEFFPDVNLDRLKTIDNFHYKISNILQKEIKNEQKQLLMKISFINDQIRDVDQTMSLLLSNDDHLSHLIERLINLTTRLKNIEVENNMYSEAQTIKNNIEGKELNISESKIKSIQTVNKLLNDRINIINNQIHNDRRHSPKLSITESDYSYQIPDNTGTGKAYTNLIILDLAVLELTTIPILIHDSILFTNIEDDVVENLILNYNGHLNKQIFIAIDSVDKYSKATKDVLERQKVITLGSNKLLFLKDWRG